MVILHIALQFSGHLMSTAQVESVLVEHQSISEAAVVAVAKSGKKNGEWLDARPPMFQ